MSDEQEKEMLRTVTVKEWGNGLGIQIPQDIADFIGIKDETDMIISLSTNNEIVLKKKKANKSLECLLSKITEENRHEPYFSEPMGKELF